MGSKIWFLSTLIIIFYKTNTASSENRKNKPLLESMIEEFGYPLETHTVTTEDNYILTLHHIPRGKNETIQNPPPPKPPALLVHGLLGCGADFTAYSNGLAYFLAERGFDVWVAHCRGTALSLGHTLYDYEADKKAYWNFSWHEIGYYDLAAIIDYILNHTKKEKLFYFGHSQGTTTFFVLTSTRPEYNQKIHLGVMLAPSAVFVDVVEYPTQALARNVGALQKVCDMMGLYELSGVTKILRNLGRTLCFHLSPLRFICESFIWMTMGYEDAEQLKDVDLARLTLHSPASASLRQFVHYAQLINTRIFRQFDYGERKNMEIYGTHTPPSYNFSNIICPIMIFYAKNDMLTDIRGAEKLSTMLPNVLRTHLIEYEKFNHIDFIYARDVITLLYDDMYKFILPLYNSYIKEMTTKL